MLPRQTVKRRHENVRYAKSPQLVCEVSFKFQNSILSLMKISSTLLNFLTTHVSAFKYDISFLKSSLSFKVIRAEVARFHERLETASSLDEMIHLHGD